MNKSIANPDTFWGAQHRLGRYGEVIGWLVRDGVLRFRRRVALILVANVMGMSLQLAALGLIFALAHALERDTLLTLAWIDIAPRESATGILVVGTVSAVLLTIAAVLVYVARTQCVVLRRRYDEFCSKRALILGSRLPLPNADEANRMLAEQRLSVIAGRQARMSGRVLAVLVNGMIPIGRALAALVVMCVISFTWTAVVVALAPIAGYVLYGVNVSAARTSWRQLRLAGGAAKAKQEFMKRMQRAAHPLTEDNADVHVLYHRGEGAKATDSFYERFFIRERARLVTSLFTALAVFAVLLVGGAQGIRGTMSWTVFGAYLVALRFFLTNARGVVSVLVQVSRCYPFLRSYCDFVQEVLHASRELNTEDVSRELAFKLLPLDGGEQGLTLKPGDRVWLLSPTGVDRTLAARLQRVTVPGERRLPGSYGVVAEWAELDHVREHAHATAVMVSRLPAVSEEANQRDVFHALRDRVSVMVTDNVEELSGSAWPVIILNEDVPTEQGWCSPDWLLAHRDVWHRVVARRPLRGDAAFDEEDEGEE